MAKRPIVLRRAVRHPWVAALAIVLAVPASAAAQAAGAAADAARREPAATAAPSRDALTDGARVRLTFGAGERRSILNTIAGPPPGHLVGAVRQASADTLYVQPPGTDAVIAVPRAAVQRLEVSRGRSRSWSAGLNLVGFAAIGALMPLQAPGCDDWCGRRTEQVVTMALAGSVVGALLPVERWQRVPESRRR